MEQDLNPTPTSETTTNDLLVKLNHVINLSTLVREIVDKSERLWSLEQSVGSSEKTRKLRNEIARLEDLLRIARNS